MKSAVDLLVDILRGHEKVAKTSEIDTPKKHMSRAQQTREKADKDEAQESEARDHPNITKMDDVCTGRTPEVTHP
mgnify:CR=1 FL=1